MNLTLFTVVMLIITTLCFICVPRTLRQYVLLAASLFYIFTLDVRALIYVTATSLLVYAAGLIVHHLASGGRRAAARPVIGISISVLVLALLFFKYAPRLAGLPFLSAQEDTILMRFALPIGFSYYVFQAISYLADLGSGKICPSRNPLSFLLYMTFFPKFVSGPIERYGSLYSQIDGLKNLNFFDAERLAGAFSWMLYGIFLKYAVADRIGEYVPKIFAECTSYSSPVLMMGSLLYTMQIYCDFCGYSALAIGIARLFGFTITENFEAPYLSDGVSAFWRRWHRSLSQWLRDYVYIPLGGSRHGLARQCFATAVVFVLCGMWHGNGLNFVVWGALHALFSITEILFKRVFYRGRRKKPTVIGRLITFVPVSFAWIFFGASDLPHALQYVKYMFTAGTAGTTWTAQMEALAITPHVGWMLLIGILIVVLMDLCTHRTRIQFPALILEWPYAARYALYSAAVILLFLYGVYGPGYDAAQFMYAAF